MAARSLLFVFLTLICITIAPDHPPRLIIWNVGQGLWTTFVTADECWHFDMGGEKMDWPALMRLCRGRANRVSLSHWDMDHISFVARARNALPRICRLNTPLGPAKRKKRAMVERLPPCPGDPPFDYWEDAKMSTTNGLSRVVQWQGVIIPGDSSRVEEKIWAERLRGLSQARILILGHHGSQTSTSRALLDRMPGLRMAIASARFQRYGHPHRKTVDTLQEFRVPLLRTEDWGTIQIML